MVTDPVSSICVGPDDDGTAFRAGADDTVLLRLPENPTTGVRWDIDELEGPIALVDDGYEQAPAGSGIGAATHRLLTFEPTGTGRAAIRLKRWQAWEGESSIDARFACTVDIG